MRCRCTDLQQVTVFPLHSVKSDDIPLFWPLRKSSRMNEIYLKQICTRTTIKSNWKRSSQHEQCNAGILAAKLNVNFKRPTKLQPRQLFSFDGTQMCRSETFGSLGHFRWIRKIYRIRPTILAHWLVNLLLLIFRISTKLSRTIFRFFCLGYCSSIGLFVHDTLHYIFITHSLRQGSCILILCTKLIQLSSIQGGIQICFHINKTNFEY